MKPLFIALKTEYYEAFKSGKKTTEYRRTGGPWNRKTCFEGRPVVVSKGYGKADRLTGVIEKFSISKKPCSTKAWQSIYGDASPAACIKIKLDKTT